MSDSINKITCKAGSVTATFSSPGDPERARWAAMTATEAFAFRMGIAATATICEVDADSERDAEIERNTTRNAILHIAMALDVEAPSGKNCSDGWALSARAVLAKVREIQRSQRADCPLCLSDERVAKLTEAKRLGLEACDLAEEATGTASKAPDCGEQVDDYHQRRAAIVTRLEAL